MRSQSADILLKLVECQNVGPPYKGWDLSALELRVREVTDLGILVTHTNSPHNLDLQHITNIASALIGSCWNITILGKAARAAREYLGLPSVEDLDPELKKMSDAVKKNKLGGLLDRFK